MNFSSNTSVGNATGPSGSGRGRRFLLLATRIVGSTVSVPIVLWGLFFGGIAATRYKRSVALAKEATLQQDLFVVCNAGRQYALDNHAAPKSLEDLVQSNYLSTVPTNPITHQKLSLQDCVRHDSMDPVETIHSYSNGTSVEKPRSAE